MKYFGLQSQIWRNNYQFGTDTGNVPCHLFRLTWLFFFFLSLNSEVHRSISQVNQNFFTTASIYYNWCGRLVYNSLVFSIRQ
jgi:hypothetical protein